MATDVLMKIKVDQGILLRELALLQGIIEKKATIPIISNVLMTATEEGRLVLQATDLEVGFRSSIEAAVEIPGTIAVHARRLHDIVRKLPAGILDFRQQEGSLHIACERIKYRLSTQEADLFPSPRTREGSPVFLLGADQLADMIKRVIFCVTTDDPRYTLSGALWELQEDNLQMVATDGHRLALSRRQGQNVGKEPLQPIVVPRKALAEMGRQAADHEGDVYFWFAAGTLFAQFGERELWTNLQDLRFPDYRKVIPAANDKILEIPTPSFREAIDRVSILSMEHTHLVKLDLKDGQLGLYSMNQQLGEAEEQLAVSYSGEPLAIGFNAQYLIDFLAVAGTERVRVILGREMGQGLFEPVRPADDRREDRYIVMPMSLH